MSSRQSDSNIQPLAKINKSGGAYFGEGELPNIAPVDGAQNDGDEQRKGS
jgi:hypothetical protein